MGRAFIKTMVIPVAFAVLGALALSGCGGGGGGGGGNPSGQLLGVSFLGVTPGPGVPPGVLPTVFRDQTLEFTFDGPLNTGVLGGFFSQNNLIVEFSGVPPTGTQGIPYYAFNDQNQARNSLQIRENIPGAPFLASYVVGRHKDKPNVIVVDPRVPAGNPLGLPSSQGFKATTTYVYIIPQGNAFLFGGAPAQPVGPSLFAIPIPIPPFTTQPALSVLFSSSLAFGPDPIPPQVTAIDSLSQAAGTPADPIPEQDGFAITFSKTIASSSIDQLKNFIVRNIDEPNATFPQGILVPGTVVPLTPGNTDDFVYIYMPSSPYGQGVSPTEGYDIEVRIGSFGQPPVVIPPLLGLPTGLAGQQLPLANSLSRIFRSTPCVGCPTPSSVVEAFDNTLQRDSTFVQLLPNNTTIPGPLQARWNDSSATGQLAGRFLDGVPTGNNMASLGTRRQFTLIPSPEAANGLFSPFDASLTNSASQCPGTHCTTPACNICVNPNGGSHIMHLYESSELGSTEDSLELIEWGPLTGVTVATTYPNYRIWCGLTSKAAPLTPLTGSMLQGLNAVFDTNYTLTPYQAGIALQAGCADPTAINPRKVPCGGPAAYTVMLQTTGFYPYPVLNPCFDFSTSTGMSGSGVNLVFEQDIVAGNQLPNFNRYRATFFNPVRRLIDRPINEVTPPGFCPNNQGGQFDVYRHRFTFCGLVAQARSLWYDTGTGGPPTYINFILTPPHTSQPAGTQSTWILEGTNTSNPQPSTNGSQGVYIDANGTVFPNVLSTTLMGLRFFRFRVELRGNHLTNAVPVYNSAVMAYTF